MITGFIIGLFFITMLMNVKDIVKYLTAMSFLIIYILNAGVTFEGENLIYCNMLMSASLLLPPSLLSRRDWAFVISGILLLFIGSDVLAIINFNNMHSPNIAHGIDVFKYLATTMVLVVLVCMSNGKLDGYTVNNKLSQIRHRIRDIFRGSDHRTHLQGS